jgi:hypothetical protein
MHTSVSSLQRVPLHRRALQTSMGGAQAILSPDDAAAILDCARTQKGKLGMREGVSGYIQARPFQL